MKNNLRKFHLVFSIVVIFLLLLIIVHLVRFSGIIYEKIGDNLYNQLHDVSVQYSTAIRAYVSDHYLSLENAAEYLANSGLENREQTELILRSLKKSRAYQYVAVVSADNGIFADSPDFFSLREEQWSIPGERLPQITRLQNGEIVFELAVPILRDSTVAGMLCAAYESGIVKELFPPSVLRGRGSLFITTADGTIVTAPETLTRFKKGEKLPGFLPEEWREKKNGFTHAGFPSAGNNPAWIDRTEGIYVALFPDEPNNWYIGAVIPVSAGEKQWQTILRECLRAFSFILASVLLLAIFFCCMQVAERRRAVLNEHCLYVLAEQSDKIFIEWNLISNTIITLSGSNSVFGKHAIQLKPLDDIRLAGTIHPDDWNTFTRIVTHIRSGKKIDKSKIRIRDLTDTFRWYLCSATVVFDGRGKPSKAILSLENIENQEQEHSQLYKRAHNDPLTGLQNKSSAEKLIEEILTKGEPNTRHAMISADLDNFKKVNDNFGHLFGDQVLIEASREIMTLFRSSDVLGRFGGDEFILFIRDIPDLDFITTKVQMLIQKMNKSYCFGSETAEISVSAGISLYPDNGTTYQQLYDTADKALYNAKRTGKNTFCLYGRNTVSKENTQKDD